VAREFRLATLTNRFPPRLVSQQLHAASLYGAITAICDFTANPERTIQVDEM
jgi:hypothetical protein